MRPNKFGPRMNKVRVMMMAQEEDTWSREERKLDLHSRKSEMIA